ncbi:hypothetical protein N658DRAFT_485309 [Parathielavia hyrcaniae]|uniref:C2H2-type domain-containing protein n=1 Tax=Parathielavia hyrcaniae TaxID=113614 RepID=A0AAN6Q2Q6_9PEZI|nr:hypothetical protein N658DRAFT_485309 [Parathielavia hyrcaniae]
MASRGSRTSTSPPTTNPTTSTTITTNTANNDNNNNDARESFLSRKKKEIVARSMALFQQSLDRCLENSAAASVSASGLSATAPAAGLAGAGAVAGRRRVKRGREEDDEELDGQCGGSGVGVSGDGGCVKGDGGGDVVVVGGPGKAKKKRVNPKEAAKGGKKFACPFCKHDPGRYKSVKTCCGPGWDDVHRVKEHIYRRHSWKSFCPRCFEHFDKPDSLKSHQRADVPCKLREKAPDTINEEQEKKLRTRAKPLCSEEEKWEEMYRVIFPGEKIPSPYYETESGASQKAGKSRFQSVDEAKEFLRTEIPRLVRPEIEHYVTTLLEEVQEKVHQKTADIIRNVETKVLMTFHFQEEQASAALSSAAAGAAAGAESRLGRCSAEPSPPPSPAAVGPEMSSKLTQLFEEYKDDQLFSELCSNVQFDWEGLLAGNQEPAECDVFSQDSAYWTSSLSGGQASYSVGGGDGYLHRY